MEWNEKLQRIIDYVENHLQRKEEPVDIEEIAQIAGCSYPFFQKVFSYMNRISFSEYIRFRKMTLAGYDLKSTNMKVVDLSFKYGYDSPTSFTKAFQQFHGVSPKEARNSQIKLQVYPKMQVLKQPRYSWKLEHKASLRLIGKSITLSSNDHLLHHKIPKFWNECQQNGVYSSLICMDTATPGGLFGLFGDFNEQTNEMKYFISVASNCNIPEGFEEIIIPEVTWAMFDCKGAVPQAIQDGWKYLNEEWLLKYPFAHAPCPELEWYSAGNSYDANYLSQIWIPIVEEE